MLVLHSAKSRDVTSLLKWVYLSNCEQKPEKVYFTRDYCWNLSVSEDAPAGIVSRKIGSWLCMENLGVDPSTSRMQSGRSTIWANSPVGDNFWDYPNILKNWSAWLVARRLSGVSAKVGLVLLKFINNSWRENKGNHYRQWGLDMWS